MTAPVQRRRRVALAEIAALLAVVLALGWIVNLALLAVAEGGGG